MAEQFTGIRDAITDSARLAHKADLQIAQSVGEMTARITDLAMLQGNMESQITRIERIGEASNESN